MEAVGSRFKAQVSEPFSDLFLDEISGYTGKRTLISPMIAETLESLAEKLGFTGFELNARDQALEDKIKEYYSKDKDKVPPKDKDKVPPKDSGTYAKSDTPAYGFKSQLHDTLEIVGKAKFMQSVNENVEKDMEIATKTIAQRLKSAITPKFNIGEDFDPSNIGYNPTQQSVAPTTTQQPKHGTKLGVNIDKVLEQSTPVQSAPMLGTLP